MQPIAVIPMKSLDRAKSRLAPHLSEGQRRRLATALLRVVIRAVREASVEALVLGADDSSRDMSLEEGAVWRKEAGMNFNESVRLAFEDAWGAGKLPLFLPSDLPLLQPDDVSTLIAQAQPETGGRKKRDPQIVLTPARSGGGTNAILIDQRLSFRPQLGRNSFQHHLAEARRLRLLPTIHSSPGLSRDLDTWEDLKEFETQDSDFLDRLIHNQPDA